MRDVLVLLLAAASAAPIGTQQRDASTEAYLALIVRYSWGEHAAVTGEVALWSLDGLQLALRDLPLVLPVVSKRHEVSEAALVATAMAVHVDVARRAKMNEEVDRHLALGQHLSKLLPGENVPDEVTRFKARWHHAAGTVLCGFSRPHDARAHFDAARQLRPGDGGILLALGSVHEVEEPGPERLARAASLYEAALAATPDLQEARLRLARIQYVSGRPADAAATIGPALQRAEGAYLRYLAWLIGAGISASQGRVDEAIARYREARTNCRRCPSAIIGLSHALLGRGDREVARGLVREIVTDEVWPPPSDPWWGYQQAQWHAVDDILERLRREVPK